MGGVRLEFKDICKLPRDIQTQILKSSIKPKKEILQSTAKCKTCGGDIITYKYDMQSYVYKIGRNFYCCYGCYSVAIKKANERLASK